MTLLVVSDIHGSYARLREVLNRQIKPPDALIFLGDGYSDINRCQPLDTTLFAVRGNCDVWSLIGMNELPCELCVTLGGYKIFMTHGDRYINRGGIDTLAAYAAQKGADILLYGHTHVRYERHFETGERLGEIRLEKPLHVFNPGSLGAPRDGANAAFGVVEIRDNGVLFSHGEI